MSVYSNFEVDLNNQNSTWTVIYKYIKDGSKILDIGCSSGYFDKVLIDKKKCTIDGIELDPQDAAEASKICRRVVVGNIETLDLVTAQLDDDYDYIIFADVLEHLVNPSAALKKVAKILSPKGAIIFSIPNMANGAVRLQLLQGNLDPEKTGLLDATHFHFYTYDSLDKMIKKSGLFLTKMRYTTYDIPEATVTKILESVGLKNSPSFMEFLSSQDSVAYQFVGSISKHKPNTDFTLFKSVKALKPHSNYEDQLKSVQADARRTFQNMVKANQVVERLSKENQELQNKLNLFRRQPIIRLGIKLRRTIVGSKK